MLNAKLTPSARELYRWILRRKRDDSKLKVDLQDFQAWASEYGENAYSDREITDALEQLQQNQLVALARLEATLRIKAPPSLLLPEDKLLIEELNARRENSKGENSKGENSKGENSGRYKLSTPLNPFMLVSLVTLSSFLVGLIPLAVGLAVARDSQPAISSYNPWQVLGEKDSSGSHGAIREKAIASCLTGVAFRKPTA